MSTIPPPLLDLREVQPADLALFFEHQRDPLACQMADFPAREREPFFAHWASILVNPQVTARTILADGGVAGNIVCWRQGSRRLVGYWLERQHWGRGIATRALAAFVALLGARPLFAYVAAHNLTSQRVLEKCGFAPLGEEGGELVYILADTSATRARVEIAPYRPAWAAEFRQIAAVLRRGLGALALRIDHIGSTAVPGLPAKDIIDLQISVAALDKPLDAALKALGYLRRADISHDHQPPGATAPPEHWQKWYFREPPSQRRTHVHVRVLGRANQRYPLLFRDYLRAHPATAAAYAQLKRRLADHLADGETYPEVKDPAVDLIYLAAEEWAAATGWQPPPSDA